MQGTRRAGRSSSPRPRARSPTPRTRSFLEPIAIPADPERHGTLSVELPCTSNSNFAPSAWAWQVTERISGSPVRTYYVELPSTLGETVDLTDLAQVEPAERSTRATCR